MQGRRDLIDSSYHGPPEAQIRKDSSDCIGDLESCKSEFTSHQALGDYAEQEMKRAFDHQSLPGMG